MKHGRPLYVGPPWVRPPRLGAPPPPFEHPWGAPAGLAPGATRDAARIEVPREWQEHPTPGEKAGQPDHGGAAPGAACAALAEADHPEALPAAGAPPPPKARARGNGGCLLYTSPSPRD
eukprot:10896457-Alexandrium_andersonii.AAC.1